MVNENCLKRESHALGKETFIRLPSVRESRVGLSTTRPQGCVLRLFTVALYSNRFSKQTLNGLSAYSPKPVISR